MLCPRISILGKSSLIIIICLVVQEILHILTTCDPGVFPQRDRVVASPIACAEGIRVFGSFGLRLVMTVMTTSPWFMWTMVSGESETDCNIHIVPLPWTGAVGCSGLTSHWTCLNAFAMAALSTPYRKGPARYSFLGPCGKNMASGFQQNSSSNFLPSIEG